MRAIMSFLERLDLNAFYQDIEVQEGAAGRRSCEKITPKQKKYL
jgi:hypothetical protein